MKRNNSILFLLIFFVVLLTACDSRPEYVPGSKKMTSLLVELHRMEGAFQAQGGDLNIDSVRKPYYTDLLGRYGLTSETYDSCIVWYTKHPKKFERIYIQVSDRLKKMEEEAHQFVYHPDDTLRQTQFWTMRRSYLITVDSLRNKIPFEFRRAEFLPEDRYELHFLQRISPRDSSTNLHAMMYIDYSNGERDSIVAYTPNDSVLRRYRLRLRARQMQPVEKVGGHLFGYDSVQGKTFVAIDSIQLHREYNPQLSEKIRKELDAIRAAAESSSDRELVEKNIVPVER